MEFEFFLNPIKGLFGKMSHRRSNALLVSGCQCNVAECQDDSSLNYYLCLREVHMDLQIKLFSGLDRGNHVIVITRGSVDIEGFKEIFRHVVNTTRSLLDCKVLIDLQDATYKLDPGDIHAFADNLRPEFWPPTNRVAMVAESDPSVLKNQSDSFFSILVAPLRRLLDHCGRFSIFFTDRKND